MRWFDRLLRRPPLIEGGLYAIERSPGRWGIAKVLKLEADLVHLRLYRNSYPAPPQALQPEELSLGRIDDADGSGIGHLPLRVALFYDWKPILIQQSAVTDDELYGYYRWKEAEGGVFGAE